MATQVTNYQCPSCTGPLQFNAESGRLECEFCGSAFTVEEVEALFGAKDEKAAEAQAEADAKREKERAEAEARGWDVSGMNEQWGMGEEGMKIYNCPSCGAELICEETTAVTSCPYCDNPTVIPGQFTGMLKPDYVIPFRLEKPAAIAALKKHYEGRPFLPKAFKDANHIEDIKGVYVPFWLFDGVAEGEVVFEGTRSHTYRAGQYRITDTEHFDVFRAGSVSFSRIPVDASKKMPDDYMDSIEPYDYGDLTEFSTAYMPGYMADKYDVTVDECSERADLRAEATAVDQMKATVEGYEGVLEHKRDIILHRGEVKYALLPVWLLTTKWNGENYLFAMNGQTGKMVGKLPVDKKKKWLTFAGIYAAGVAVMTVLAFLLGGFGM